MLGTLTRRIKGWIQPMSGAVDPDFFDARINAALFARYGGRMPRGVVAHDELSRRDLANRAIAHYQATHALLRIYGPIWLRSLAFLGPAVTLPLVWLARRRTSVTTRASVVGVSHYSEFAGYARDAGGPETVPVQPPAPRLTRRDLAWFAGLVRECPRLALYPEVLLRGMMRCGQYAELMRAHECVTIVDFMEHTPTGPIAYGFCRSRGVALVNAMHGDRGYTVVFGFGVFARMGIWGEYYRGLFERLLVAAEAVSLTPCSRHRELGALRRIDHRPRRLVVMYETTFAVGSPYLRALTEFLAGVDDSWEIGIRVRRRREHERAEVPAFLMMLRDRLGSRFDRIVLTDPESTPMAAELASASVAVAVYSSALMEAWLAGCRVVRIAPPDGRFKLYHPPYGDSAAYRVYDGTALDPCWFDEPIDLARERALLEFVSLGAAQGAFGSGE